MKHILIIILTMGSGEAVHIAIDHFESKKHCEVAGPISVRSIPTKMQELTRAYCGDRDWENDSCFYPRAVRLADSDIAAVDYLCVASAVPLE